MMRNLLVATILCIPNLTQWGNPTGLVEAHRRSYSAVAGGLSRKPQNVTNPNWEVTSEVTSSVAKQRTTTFKDYLCTSYSDGDTLERYSGCVKKVLKELRPENYDTSIPALYRIRSPTFTRLWDANDWKMHTSRWRYVRYMVDFPTSRLLRRCWPQMLILSAWSVIAVVMGMHGILVGRVQIALTPLSLISSFVAALLTLRTNQGLSRLSEARTSFGYVILQTREMAQLIGTSVYPRDRQLGLLAARHVTLFGWTLQAHLRGVPNSVSDIISTMLPSPSDSEYILNYERKPPAALIMRMRCIFDYLAKYSNLDPEVQGFLLDSSFKLNEALMITEKIRNSPLPPIYTAHTTRLLLFYLFWLPLALYGTLKDPFITVIVTIAVGYAMLGLDEISHILENPFLFMPLHQLSKMSMIDSSDALVYKTPPLFHDRASTHTKQSPPEYW